MSVLWRPSKSFVESSNLHRLADVVREQYATSIDSYAELWEWSIEHDEEFWSMLFSYFSIPHSGELSPVRVGDMPRTRWFPRVELNYVEHILANARDEQSAIIYKTEQTSTKHLTWKEVKMKVAVVQQYLLACGLEPGDRVAAFLPNIPEASIAFLATVGLGGVWSSCSPDFGADSVVDRFAQIAPKVLIGVDGYYYGGKSYAKLDVVSSIFDALDETDHLLMVPFLGLDETISTAQWTSLESVDVDVVVRRMPFSHPIWILFSSGTTGAPKAITHGHGGVLLEHLKYMAFHNDVHPGERFFWYSTTGWMMWNFVHASWLVGGTVVLYDGSPGYPTMNALWQFAAEEEIDHFGTSAPFILACMKKGVSPANEFDLSNLRSIGSTGSPLPPEAFDWIYTEVKKDLWLCSMSGGTDVCTAFVGGCPVMPVVMGEIQCRALGCALYSWDEAGHHDTNRVGEMVITKPMPSMPIYFWHDEDYKRYTASYFDVYDGVWRHGDWVEIKDSGSLIIYGRSDATLNRQGIRIGTSEIYRALHDIEALKDSLIVNIELKGGKHYMPLFVQLKEGAVLTDALIKEIKTSLRTAYTPRHVPDDVIEVPDIPYTISGKKMEAPVKKILMGMSTADSLNKGAMRNPQSMAFFETFAESM